MSSLDERPFAEGGGGARPTLAAERGGFIDRHRLWGAEQYAAAQRMRRVIDELGLAMVRFSFADQHGLLRGKTITRAGVASALRSGLTAPSSLLLKDSSGRSVFPVFSAEPFGGFTGAGDIVLVPDPTTFRVLPWAPRTGWVLCDVRRPDGSATPFCTRSLLRSHLAGLAARGYAMTVGVELEFHVFRALAPDLEETQVGAPGRPGLPSSVGPTSAGSQLLLESDVDRLDDVIQLLHDGLTALDLPLRSLELEFGPSQLELTLSAGDAARAADEVVLTRSAIRQLCRRHGYHATFMARPAGIETASTGWHLHQSLRCLATGQPVFDPGDGETVLSEFGRHYLGGLLAHARAATVFSTPTVNGYKRYLPHSLAPDRVVWGVDNKGALVRVAGGGLDSGTRLENRSGEPAANPYLYIASQLVSGVDGVARGLDPGLPAEDPYGTSVASLPRSLAEALDALDADGVFADALGPDVVAWYSGLKRAEFARYLAHVSDWEQREYFDLC